MVAAVSAAIDIQSLVVVIGYRTAGVDEVAIGKALLDITAQGYLAFLTFQRVEGIVGRIVGIANIRGERAVDVCLPIVVLLAGNKICAVVVALVQIESVEVVGHLTVVERLVGHYAGIASVAGSGQIETFIALRVIAVHYLGACSVRRVTEYGIVFGFGRRCGSALYPAVLHITAASLGHAGTGERAHDTEVVNTAAEVVKQRVVESANGVSVTMHYTIKASAFVIAYRCPLIGNRRIIGMGKVCLEEELQVASCSYLAIYQAMANQLTVRTFCGSRNLAISNSIVDIATRNKAEVIEVLKEVEAVGGGDINLRVTFHILVIYVHVVGLVVVGHHIGQVVVVGHAHLYGVAEGLAEVGLCIICHPVLVLIPV